jgi:SsrA-binding protein
MGNNSKKEPGNVLARNRKAFHDYFILETYEAGVELKGTEVKSCRAGNISAADAYAKIENGQIFLLNVHISPYENGNRFNHEPKRARRLLLHKREILKLNSLLREKGHTLVPLKFYLKRGRVKVEIGIGKGKNHGDKRDTLRKRQDDLDARRALGKK